MTRGYGISYLPIFIYIIFLIHNMFVLGKQTIPNGYGLLTLFLNVYFM